MKKILSFVFLLFLVALPMSAIAAEFAGGEQYNLAGNETVDGDLYAGGGVLIVGGEVAGDLVAAGGNATVTGNIGQDLILAGGQINLLGTVGDDVRVAGGNITVNTKIGDDLILAGGSLQVLSETEVGGDLVANGGVIFLAGDVQGDLVANGGELRIDSTVNGSVQLRGEKITIGKTAVIEGDLEYVLPKGVDLVIEDGAEILGEVVRVDSTVPNGAYGNVASGILKGIFGALLIVKIFSILFAGLVLYYIWPQKVQKISTEVLEHKLENFLFGLAVLLVVPVVTALLFLILVGWYLAFILLALYAVMLILAAVVSGISFGVWLWQVIGKKAEVIVDWKVVLVGILALTLVTFIPIIGWIVAFVIFFITLGGMFRMYRDRFYQERR